MLWATERLVHFDRVASAWLISRFVDADPSFMFVERGSACPPEAIMFSGVEGELSRHDDQGSTFAKIIRKYRLADPALELLERVVDAGIAYVMHGRSPGSDDEIGALALGALAIAEGTLVIEESDDAVLYRGMATWDALYVQLSMQALRRGEGTRGELPEGLRSTRFAMALARPRQVIARARRQPAGVMPGPFEPQSETV